MDAVQIDGGRPLSGAVEIDGAKNAALPILAAALLVEGPVQLERVPDVADVRVLVELARGLGLELESAGGGRLHLAVPRIVSVRPSRRLARLLRASFCVLGPLLARAGRAVVPLPGGCRIGARPVDLHLRGLAALGAELHLERGWVVARARRLRGAEIDLGGKRGPTVTGTANVLLAAVLARGRTILSRAACEPEIGDLCRFLNGRGARIEGIDSPTLEIDGVDGLAGGRHAIIPDRIEAATWLVAACLAGGRVELREARPEHLEAVLCCLHRAGAEIEAAPRRLVLCMDRRPRPVDYLAGPFPAPPTDVQPLWTALMTRAMGVSRVADTVFGDRFTHVAELLRMGASIRRNRQGLAIAGRRRLRAAEMVATDLRGGAALLLAALATAGRSRIFGCEYLDRGYARWTDKLSRLGAIVARKGQDVREPASDARATTVLNRAKGHISAVKTGLRAPELALNDGTAEIAPDVGPAILRE